jgi:hypothetical protein
VQRSALTPKHTEALVIFPVNALRRRVQALIRCAPFHEALLPKVVSLQMFVTVEPHPLPSFFERGTGGGLSHFVPGLPSSTLLAKEKPEAASEIIDQSLPRRAPNEFSRQGGIA